MQNQKRSGFKSDPQKVYNDLNPILIKNIP